MSIDKKWDGLRDAILEIKKRDEVVMTDAGPVKVEHYWSEHDIVNVAKTLGLSPDPFDYPRKGAYVQKITALLMERHGVASSFTAAGFRGLSVTLPTKTVDVYSPDTTKEELVEVYEYLTQDSKDADDYSFEGKLDTEKKKPKKVRTKAKWKWTPEG